MLTRTVGTDARADQRHMCFFGGPNGPIISWVIWIKGRLFYRGITIPVLNILGTIPYDNINEYTLDKC